MKSRKWHLGMTLGISILILVSVLVFADGVEAKTKVNIQAEKSRYLKKQGLYIIEGNPFIKYKDYTISADLIKYFEDDDRAIFTGNVVVLQNETRIHADTMQAELKDEEFIIDGNVDIYYVRKEKEADPAGESTTEQDSAEATTDAEVTDQEVVTMEAEDPPAEKSNNDVIKIRAQHVEFTKVNDADHLVANTDVVMEVDDQTITSEYLEYQGDQEMVVARESVQVVGADEEELFTDEFTYWLEGEEEGFEATGGVKLEFFIDSDDVATDAETDSRVDETEELSTDSTQVDQSAETTDSDQVITTDNE